MVDFDEMKYKPASNREHLYQQVLEQSDLCDVTNQVRNWREEQAAKEQMDEMMRNAAEGRESHIKDSEKGHSSSGTGDSVSSTYENISCRLERMGLEKSALEDSDFKESMMTPKKKRQRTIDVVENH